MGHVLILVYNSVFNGAENTKKYGITNHLTDLSQTFERLEVGNDACYG